MIWTDERKELLRTLWPGHSGAQIGERMGVSRNAVLGMVDRMNLPPKVLVRSGRVAKVPAARRPGHPRKSLPVPVSMPEALDGGVGIMELRETTCRWPLSADPANPDFRYCGGRAPVRQPYCAEHKKLARNPVQRRRL